MRRLISHPAVTRAIGNEVRRLSVDEIGASVSAKAIGVIFRAPGAVERIAAGIVCQFQEGDALAEDVFLFLGGE
jgi:hypothetical protein